MVVVPRGKKDLSEIVKELDDYFLKAAEAGSRVSFILEAPLCDLSSNQDLAGNLHEFFLHLVLTDRSIVLQILLSVIDWILVLRLRCR